MAHAPRPIGVSSIVEFPSLRRVFIIGRTLYPLSRSRGPCTSEPRSGPRPPGTMNWAADDEVLVNGMRRLQHPPGAADRLVHLHRHRDRLVIPKRDLVFHFEGVGGELYRWKSVCLRSHTTSNALPILRLDQLRPSVCDRSGPRPRTARRRGIGLVDAHGS